MRDGSVVEAEKAVADAHPNGAAPWGEAQYKAKLERQAAAHLDAAAVNRLWQGCVGLSGLDAGGLLALNPLIPALGEEPRTTGIFDWPSDQSQTR